MDFHLFVTAKHEYMGCIQLHTKNIQIIHKKGFHHCKFSFKSLRRW